MFSHLERKLRMKPDNSLLYMDLPLTHLFFLLLFVIGSVFIRSVLISTPSVVPLIVSDRLLSASHNKQLLTTSQFPIASFPPLTTFNNSVTFVSKKEICRLELFIYALGAKINLSLMLSVMFLKGHFTHKQTHQLIFHHFCVFIRPTTGCIT